MNIVDVYQNKRFVPNVFLIEKTSFDGHEIKNLMDMRNLLSKIGFLHSRALFEQVVQFDSLMTIKCGVNQVHGFYELVRYAYTLITHDWFVLRVAFNKEAVHLTFYEDHNIFGNFTRIRVIVLKE